MPLVGYGAEQHNVYYQTFKDYFMEIRIENPIPAPREICFSVGDGNWIMKLTPEGVRFNLDDYPLLTQYGVAKTIIDILEKSFDVEFKKKPCSD